MNTKRKPRTDFLKHIAEGDTVKDAAAKVYMSPRTIDAHLGRLRESMKARNTTHLIYKATKSGII